jgi:xanthine dehydrogenase accessory factor
MGNSQDSKLQPWNRIVLIRGAGEQATGVAWALHKAGFRVVMSEISKPLMVRWPVCFGSAVEEGTWRVEEVEAIRIETPFECQKVWENGKIPILIDPELEFLTQIRPDVLVDAIMAKRNLGTQSVMAPLTIGLGPGFSAGEDVHLVAETNRGHNLGRLIYSGGAEPNTGIPGDTLGYTRERVVYASESGIFAAKREIGETIKTGELLGEIIYSEPKEVIEESKSLPVYATLDGVLRGLLRSGTFIKKGVKIGDIDPRYKEEYCWTISEKARMLGSSVLLGILEWQRMHAHNGMREQGTDK